MSRVLVPRGPCCSSKLVSSADFELYFGDALLTDHIICGFTLSVGGGTRSIDVAAGKGRVLGLHLDNTVACTDAVACLAICDVHTIYVQVNRDGMCRPCNWTFTSNTTGTTPCCAFKIGTATTDCTGTTASVTTIGTAQETGVAQGTAFPAEYVTNRLFWRSDENNLYSNTGTEASPLFTSLGGSLFGDGADGADTNPVNCADPIKHYTCLTFNCNTTWTLACLGPALIYVSGTLTIAACVTWTINGGHENNGGGIGGGGGGGSGGTGGNPHSVIILAAAITAGANAKILLNGNDGCDGANGSGASNTNGRCGQDAKYGVGIGGVQSSSAIGGVGGNTFSRLEAFTKGRNGGTGLGTGALKRFKTFSSIITSSIAGGGAGGGGGGEVCTGATLVAGGAGGGGGDVLTASGGRGGNSGQRLSATCGSAGSGGGGGGSVAILLVTKGMDSDLEMEAIAGAGGDGGNDSGDAAGGGGGGGGAAGVYLFGDADIGTRSTTVGGAGGAGTGNTAGSVGVVGTADDEFHNINTAEFYDSI